MLDASTLKRATFATAPPAPEPVDRTPVIAEKMRKENLRRVRSNPAFVTENADDTRTWVHDPQVQRDVLISSGSTDRGEGSKDSISMLRDEDAPEVDGLLADLKERLPLDRTHTRDGRGHFVRNTHSCMQGRALRLG